MSKSMIPAYVFGTSSHPGCFVPNIATHELGEEIFGTFYEDSSNHS
jgi:hypothetical protein